MIQRPLLAACLLPFTVLVTAPALAQEVPERMYFADEGQPAPSTRWKLMVGGLGTTAAFYALAQPFSYAWPDAPGGMDLRIPVAGPWMALADTGCADDEPDCSTAWVIVRALMTTIGALGQTGGLAIAIEGLFVTTSDVEPLVPSVQPTAPGVQPTERRDRPDRTEDPIREPQRIFLAPTPMTVGSDGVGLGVIGVF